MDDDQGRSRRAEGETAIKVALLLALLAAAAGTAAAAQDEHTHRLAAELAIMAGDARLLVQPSGGPLEREGRALRLRGALASLPLLLRRAVVNPEPVAALRQTLDRKDWPALVAQLEPLTRRHPFAAHPLLTAPPTPQTFALGAALHRENCAGCHDGDWGDTRLPAKNLATQAATLPRTEFAARVWLGVRGTRDFAYANPFSHTELAALIAYYSQPR